jgi:hypothetical protein
MRNLTKKQIKMIEELFRRYRAVGLPLYDVDGMTLEEWDRIDGVHPCEINYQNANRVISDLNFKLLMMAS